MKKRHAEIVGAGFAGLTAACALAQRGWSVRVHERGERLRTTGAGIYIYENGLRVLAAVGAYDAAVKGAPFAHTREVRDDRNRVISVHRWVGSRVFSIVRQTVINALAAAAARAGAEIVTGSVATGASADGKLVLADGRRLSADLIVAADGSNSALRDGLGLLSMRKYLVDGCDAPPDREDRRGTAVRRRRHHGRILVRQPTCALHALQRDRRLYRAHDARQRRARQGDPGATRMPGSRGFRISSR